MSAAEVFFDTNVLLYLLSADNEKADRAERLLEAGGIISVQVLNEFANVAHRKISMPWEEIREFLDSVKSICTVVDITLATHEQSLAIAERYQLSVYDSLIISAALQANCTTLYSEDMQHGQRIDNSLTIKNPFR